MKRIVATVLAASMMVMAATGCSKTESSVASDSNAVSSAASTETAVVSAASTESVVASAADSASAEGAEASSEASTAETGKTEDATNVAVPEDAETLEGTIDEVKESMFVVATADGKYYAFNFDENVNATKDDFAQGDNVKLYYTGELSEVDAFTGTVYRVEVVK